MFELESWWNVFVRVVQVEAILLAQIVLAGLVGLLLKRRGEAARRIEDEASVPIGRMERRLILPQGGTGKTSGTKTREPLTLCERCGRNH